MLCSLQNRRIDVFESPPALGCRFFISLFMFSYDNPCSIKLLISPIVNIEKSSTFYQAFQKLRLQVTAFCKHNITVQLRVNIIMYQVNKKSVLETLSISVKKREVVCRTIAK